MCPDQYKNGDPLKKQEYDYGLIKLDKPVKRTLYFRIGVDYQEKEEEVSLYGYPS